MRTVKLTIEVEVPDKAEWLSVDSNGIPVISKAEPIQGENGWYPPVPEKLEDDEDENVLFRVHFANVKNWRNLKINLREYFEKQYRVLPIGHPVDSTELSSVEKALGMTRKEAADLILKAQDAHASDASDSE